MALGYDEADLTAVPEGDNIGLGCGNPQALALLKSAEMVLHLGFDCFLAAKHAGPSGRLVGVDTWGWPKWAEVSTTPALENTAGKP
ncbi:MAG: hypothetical protein U0183_11025 [Polyangiaceae bacterium]